jgi:hypothetical protein
MRNDLAVTVSFVMYRMISLTKVSCSYPITCALSLIDMKLQERDRRQTSSDLRSVLCRLKRIRSMCDCIGGTTRSHTNGAFFLLWNEVLETWRGFCPRRCLPVTSNLVRARMMPISRYCSSNELEVVELIASRTTVSGSRKPISMYW